MPASLKQPVKQPLKQPLKQPASAQLVWERLLKDMERVRGAIKHAQTALSNEAPAVSTTTRRRASARAAGELHKAAACVEDALTDLQHLRRVAATHSGRVTNLSGRLHQVESVLTDKTQQLQRLQRQVSSVSSLQPPLSDETHASTQVLQAQLKQLQAKCDALNAHADELSHTSAAQVEELKKQLRQTDEALQHAQQQLKQQVATQEHHHAVTERQQRVIAALTADNVMHMVKLRAAQDEAIDLRSKADALRGRLESQQGPWFEQVRSGVQHHVQAALTRTQHAETALEEATARYKAEQAALEQQLEGAQQRAQQAETRAVQAEATWEAHAASCEADKAAANEAALSAQRAADVCAAEVDVLQRTVHDLQEALFEAQAQLATRTAAHGETLEQLAAAHTVVEQRDAQIAGLQAQLEQQQDINTRLMARKQDVEWQLLQTLAHTKGQ